MVGRERERERSGGLCAWRGQQPSSADISWSEPEQFELEATPARALCLPKYYYFPDDGHPEGSHVNQGGPILYAPLRRLMVTDAGAGPLEEKASWWWTRETCVVVVRRGAGGSSRLQPISLGLSQSNSELEATP